MALSYHPQSLRARKARWAEMIAKYRSALLGVTGLLMIAGLMLLVIQSSVGWLLVGIAIVPLLLLQWDSDDLMPLTPEGETSLDQCLEREVLAALPGPFSPQDLARAAMQSRSGQFFVARFGLSPQFLINASSDDRAAADAVITKAMQLRSDVASQLLSGGMIIAALGETQSGVRGLLPHLQLKESDLVWGVRWYERLRQLIAEQGTKRRSGGLARDWNFGYTNLLERFGVNFSQMVARGRLLHVRVAAHQTALTALLQIFSASGRQNVALIGPAGVGKTTIVRAFAEVLMDGNSQLPSTLKYSQVISLDASSLISAARSRSELESLVNRILVEAYQAKNIIIFLDDAELFLADGPGSVDLSSILLPVLEGGRLRMIVTMDEQRYLQLSQRSPSLASSLNRINVAPASRDDSLAVMQDQLIGFEFDQKVTYMYQALVEAYRLSERYQHELAQPGKSVRLLERAARVHESGLVTAASVAKTIEETSGVKVSRVDTSDERERLLRLEDLIHERMINQKRAVHVVADALRRARAGVRNESRPIGTFLFLGPTGVGKTELAKSLAAVYFGGEDRVARLDLNEFVRAEDVSRLIADGEKNPHSLTAQIMRQPFSVVLLDEIEKAHPQVLTTLLQMLDEGVLRDESNREVSFRDAIVIATSNAGADTIRQLIDRGYDLEKIEGEFVNRLIDTGQFRPEFLNRFDEIVLFRPLTEDELAQVVTLMVAGVNRTLEPQKITVQLNDAAVSKLARIGYDPRLGARPMRRVVQRSIESLIARRLLEGSIQPGQTVMIHESDITDTSSAT